MFIRRFCAYLATSTFLYFASAAYAGLYNGTGPGKSTIGVGGDYETLVEAFDDMSYYHLSGEAITYSRFSTILRTTLFPAKPSWPAIHLSLL